MKTYVANAINAIVLIVLSAWGYFSSDTPSMTALIPTGIGLALLLCTSGFKKENKAIAHIAVLLTFVVIIGLIKPLMGSLERDDMPALIRVCVMLFTSALAMITFVRSFIEARKNRDKA